jgi:nicotinamide mononucleotide transporter
MAGSTVTVDWSTTLIVEILATCASLLYILLMVRENIACWVFGISSSLLSIYLFIDVRLYSEAALYAFYAAMGVWGWLQWHRRMEVDRNPVVRWRIHLHLRAIVFGGLVALGLGYVMQNFSDAQRPAFNALTTVFSVLGTYLEINKVLEAWVYWLIINVASIWLYHDRDLDIYAALMVLYSALSVWGYWRWSRTYRMQRAA